MSLSYNVRNRSSLITNNAPEILLLAELFGVYGETPVANFCWMLLLFGLNVESRGFRAHVLHASLGDVPRSWDASALHPFAESWPPLSGVEPVATGAAAGAADKWRRRERVKRVGRSQRRPWTGFCAGVSFFSPAAQPRRLETAPSSPAGRERDGGCYCRHNGSRRGTEKAMQARQGGEN